MAAEHSFANKISHLSACTHHWGDYYIKVVNQVLAGNWKPDNIWGGTKEGMIKLGPISSAVPAAVRSKVAQIEAEMKTGKFWDLYKAKLGYC